MRHLLCLVFVIHGAVPSSTQYGNPPFWVIQRNEAKVFVLGFSDANSRDWLTPTVEAAFGESSDLWLETPAPGERKWIQRHSLE
jgi:hypothetical protein